MDIRDMSDEEIRIEILGIERQLMPWPKNAARFKVLRQEQKRRQLKKVAGSGDLKELFEEANEELSQDQRELQDVSHLFEPVAMLDCCHKHLTTLGVVSPTECPECGGKWIVRDAKWHQLIRGNRLTKHGVEFHVKGFEKLDQASQEALETIVDAAFKRMEG